VQKIVLISGTLQKLQYAWVGKLTPVACVHRSNSVAGQTVFMTLRCLKAFALQDGEG